MMNHPFYEAQQRAAALAHKQYASIVDQWIRDTLERERPKIFAELCEWAVESKTGDPQTQLKDYGIVRETQDLGGGATGMRLKQGDQVLGELVIKFVL